MSQISDILQTIDGANKQFASTLDKSQARLLAEALDLAKTLDIKNGKIAPSIENLKRISSIKAKLNKAVVNSDYLKSVKDLVGNFDTIQAAQNAYFYPTAAKFTAAKKQALIKEISIDNTISQLTETGLAANVTDEIRNKLLKSVTSGAQYNDLVAEMTQYLTDTEESPGALSKYAQTYVNTALNQFAGNNNKLMTEDLGMEWFRYVGSNKETSREFCIHLEAKDYVHVSEIPEILRGHIDGHKCKIYPATGLPYGMIDGTTPDNFMTNRGGWNCGHQLIPVMEASVPDSFKAKIKTVQAKPSDANIKADEVAAQKAKLEAYKTQKKPKAKPSAQKAEPESKTAQTEELLPDALIPKPIKVTIKQSQELVKAYLAKRGDPAVRNQRLTKLEFDVISKEYGPDVIKTRIDERRVADVDREAARWKLSDEEKYLIHSYTETLYTHINDASRNGEVGINTLVNDRLNVAISKCPTYKGSVNRTISIPDADVKILVNSLKSLGPDKALMFDQMLSTTVLHPGELVFGGNVLFEIASKNGRLIEGLSLYKNEREVLFRSDARFKYISSRDEKPKSGDPYTVIKLKEV